MRLFVGQSNRVGRGRALIHGVATRGTSRITHLLGSREETCGDAVSAEPAKGSLE